MKRVVGVGVLILAALAGLFWPLLPAMIDSLSGTSSAPDPVTITRYEGTYDVASSGRLVATETITAKFPVGRHGIFRFWDVVDPSDPAVRLLPNVTAVTMDGQPVPWEASWQQGGRYYVAKIGDPDVTLRSGSHVYVIAYTVDGALAPPSAGTGTFASTEGSTDGPPGSVFYWNVVAQGWGMPITQASVRITLPGPAAQVQCSAGRETADGTAAVAGPCGIKGTGTRFLALTAQDLPPRSGMTVRATQAAPPPPRTTLPWSVTLDPILGTSPQRLLGVLILAAAALIGSWAWARTAREEEPGFPVQYVPPPGLGPAQTVYIATEAMGAHSLTATLLYLADRRLVRLDHRPDDTWLVTGLATPQQWQPYDPVARTLGEHLGVTAPGAWFLADRAKGSGETLSTAKTAIESTTKAWARNGGFLRSAPGERWGQYLWLLAMLLAGIAFIRWLGNPTSYGLPFAAFVIGGSGFMRVGVGTRRTATGRDLWSRAWGFRRLLATPSSEDRFDFAARQDLFIAYVPYAVGFGVADLWARKYRDATGQEAPVPMWYPYALGYGSPYDSSTGFDSFNSALSASLSAYQASQSSSGGGGGFGGGGGGGGGGSW